MATRPTQSPSTLILPPAYCGGIGRYALMMRHANTVIDTSGRFDKRFKTPHRCTIADTRGPLQLTVPIAKPAQHHGTRWADIQISLHGRWWDVHRIAIASAYGRTPFYEFLIDRFEPLWLRFASKGCSLSLMDFDEAIEAEICQILGIPAPVYATTPPEEGCRVSDTTPYDAAIAPYWQVRQSELGFLGGMSILDLIFNLGPEAATVI
jgi:hypothetical protein